MKKQKPIKEKIFIKNHKQKRLLDQWEKYDPITRRVLYDGYYNYKDSYYYLKISITKEYLLCSYVECRVVIFPNSEFVKNECKSFVKVFFENEKVYSKDWNNIRWRIWEFAFKKKKTTILNILGLDFLEEEDFIFIDSETLFKKLLLKKITNSKNLFKEYFRTKFGKTSNLPLKLAKEHLKNLRINEFNGSNYYNDELDRKDFFRILKTSKNAHITINNFEKITQYKHIKDLSYQANLLKEKINYNRSVLSLEKTHQTFSEKILQIRISAGMLSTKNVYKINFPFLNNLYPLQTEEDFYREGYLQKHCIYSYYKYANKKINGREDMFFSYRKENQILATIQVKINLKGKNKKYEIVQLFGKGNKILSKELNNEITNNLENYYTTVLENYFF